MCGCPGCGEAAFDGTPDALSVFSKIQVVGKAALVDRDFTNALDFDVAGVAAVSLTGVFGSWHRRSPYPCEVFHKSFHKWALERLR